MKKIYTLVIIALIVTLSACVDIDRIEDNFIKEGYTKSEDASDFVGTVLTSFSKDGVEVESYVYRKNTNIAVVLVFETSNDVENELENNNTLQGFIEDLEEDDLVRRNMLLIPISGDKQEMIEIFND